MAKYPRIRASEATGKTDGDLRYLVEVSEGQAVAYRARDKRTSPVMRTGCFFRSAYDYPDEYTGDPELVKTFALVISPEQIKGEKEYAELCAARGRPIPPERRWWEAEDKWWEDWQVAEE
jgi:hypothetical protein